MSDPTRASAPAERRKVLVTGEECLLSQRVDGPWHSWRFDGDDPYVICHYCDECRDANTGVLIRKGRTE